MKKNMLFLAIFFLIFCLRINNTLKADAYTEALEVMEGDFVDTPYAQTLTKGYYAIGTRPYVTSIENFKGDFSYYHVDPKNQITMDDIRKVGPIDIEENILQRDLVDTFNIFFKDYIREFGATILKVHSSAVFFTNGEEYTAEIMGVLTKQPNSDTSIAGNMSHFSSIDHPLSLASLKERYQATDNVDGNITNRLQFETNYNPDKPLLGSYYFIVKATDNAGHEACAIDIIHIKDFIPPVISFKDNKSEIDIEVNSSFSVEDAKKYFSATDNYTPKEQLRYSYTDNFSKHMNKLGNYSYTCYVQDSDHNQSRATLKINIVDTTKPTIILNGGGDTIYSDHVLEDNEILALFSVSDNYYTISNSQIQITSNTCTGKQGTEYRITLRVTDGSNNTQEQTFKYYLTDMESPIIMVEKTLYLPLGSYYTNKEILNMLKTAGIISNDAIDVSLIYNDFHTDKEGSYEITYVETLADGKTNEGKIHIHVFSPVEPDYPNLNETESTYNSLWYLLLLLLPLSFIPIIFFIRHKKYGKN